MMKHWLLRLWNRLIKPAPTRVEVYRQFWAQPVVIDGEERLPVARKLL